MLAEVENVEPLAVKLAVRITFPPGGGLKGAVYTPALVTEPHAPCAELWQLSEYTTPVAGDPLLVTLNACCAPAAIVRLEGVIARLAPNVMVTVAVADFVVSAAATAEIVTVAGLGTAAGAVYKPAEEIEPTVEMSPNTSPLTSQVTALVEPPVTVAVNCAFCVVATDAVVGLIVTLTVLLLDPPHATRDISAAKTNRNCSGFIVLLRHGTRENARKVSGLPFPSSGNPSEY